MKKSPDWKGRTGGHLLGQKALILFFRWLDVRLGYGIMALVAPFYMFFSRNACLAIYTFFRKRMGYPAAKALAATYRNHYAFGQVILDRFAVFAGKKRFFETNIVGNEHFRRLIAGDKGFVIAGSHVGNFEICGYLLNAGKKKINALIYAGETKIVQQNRVKTLGANNVNLIPVLDDMTHLFAAGNALQNGQIVSMPCDRHLGSAKAASCRFLGEEAAFPVGAFALAVHFDVEIVAIHVMKQSNKKYTVYVCPVRIDSSAAQKASPREKAQLYAVAFAENLEAIVRQYPEQWFNYYDFWKKQT